MKILTMSALLTILVFFGFVINSLNTVNKPEEVEQVNEKLIKAHNWERANFDDSCVSGLTKDGDYYWCTYDSPDQFDEIIYISMDKKTFRKLEKYLKTKKFKHSSIYKPTIKFVIYYSNCNTTILKFEKL